jgi:16S rRNA (adenine1518-N6/adenine1519-N6)-dimethyltransferase
MAFETKKSLGQNFIHDLGFLNSILNQLDLLSTDTVIEVGAGMGTLTECLAKRVGRVIAFEIDRRLEPILSEKFASTPNVTLVFADALKTPYDFPPDYRVVANIPYYITTPLVMKFLRDPRCREIGVLVQDDVARRIVAATGADFGALGVACQACAACKIVKFVPRGLFKPVPKVDSAFVSLTKFARQSPISPGFETFIKNVFSKRRKKLSNSVPIAILNECGIDGNLRPENISVADFLKIFDAMENRGSINRAGE